MLSATELSMLAAGGLAAGVLNTLAGGGSLLTVPLLIALGLPAGLANGTNRVGIFFQNASAAWGFRRRGVDGWPQSRALLAPVLCGGIVGALGVSLLSDQAFQRLFGFAMLALLPWTLRPPKLAGGRERQPLSPLASNSLFFAIGLYGGAVQAGVGILLVAALSMTGHSLVLANSMKILLTLIFTAAAVPIFIVQGQVAWIPGLVLAVGFALGGEIGAHLAVGHGDRLLRPVLAFSIVLLAGHMLGFY